jgi:hypothetical protein
LWSQASLSLLDDQFAAVDPYAEQVTFLERKARIVC